VVALVSTFFTSSNTSEVREELAALLYYEEGNEWRGSATRDQMLADLILEKFEVLSKAQEKKAWEGERRMNEAHPADGVIILSRCAECYKAIVWSQHGNCWLHQATYDKQCLEKEKPMSDTYDVNVVQDGHWWMIEVPVIKQITQARNKNEIELMARELIAVTLDLPLGDITVELNFLGRME
jgi:hypothetical protein